MSEQTTLFAKLATITALCRSLPKTGYNAFDKYHYVKADTITEHLGALLSEHKVMFFPAVVSTDTMEITTKKGDTNLRTVVQMQMTFACADTGATWSSLWEGEAADRSDKSISKAITSATKYFFLKTFQIVGNEYDPDAESPETEAKQKAGHNPPPPSEPNYPVATDEIFEPTTPAALGAPYKAPKDTLSSDQLGRVKKLAKSYYGATNEAATELEVCQKLSKGAVSTYAELTVKEAEVLIKTLEKRISEAAAQAQSSGSPLGATVNGVAAK